MHFYSTFSLEQSIDAAAKTPQDRKNRNFGFDLTLEIDSETAEKPHVSDFCSRVIFESTLCKHFKEIKKSLDKFDRVV